VGIPIATTSDFEGKRKDTAFTPRASVSFKPNRDHNFYLSYSRGFKGGGFDPRGQSTQAPTQTPAGIYDYMAFDPETVDSIELGWKASLGRLQVATAIFNADYKDVQIPGVGRLYRRRSDQPSAGSPPTPARRGSEAWNRGNLRVAEDMAGRRRPAELRRLAGLSRREIQRVPIAVDPSRAIPPAEFNIAPIPKGPEHAQMDDQRLDRLQHPGRGGRLYANTTLSYRSSSPAVRASQVPMLDQKGFALWDANLVWRSAGGRFEVGLHGKNLTNKRYVTAGYNFLTQNPFTGDLLLTATRSRRRAWQEGVLTAYYGNPRQVFLSLGMNF
jgi:iron complex outermembrane recepter protein